MRRTAGWVTVRLRGAVSGRQLTKLAEQIGIRRVRRCGQETELTLRAADLNRVRHLLRGAGVDMTTAEPVSRALETFGRLLDEMEALTA